MPRSSRVTAHHLVENAPTETPVPSRASGFVLGARADEEPDRLPCMTVTRIDRLARSTFDLFGIVKRIVDAKAQFRSIYFKPDGRTTEKAIVSAKGGDNVNVAMVRDLGHVVDREKAKIGVFLTLAEPTAPMKTEAVKAGYYETEFGKYPKLQILTIKELFEAKKPQIPLVDPTAFNKTQREDTTEQGKLSL